jgi:hypothetical protein
MCCTVRIVVTPNVGGNRRAALAHAEGRSMNRVVQFTERLALGDGQERILAPITKTSKLATVELDKFT